MSIFTKEGFKALRWVYGVTLAGVGVAAFLVAGSYIYWQSEKDYNGRSAQTLRDLRGRLEEAKRERDALRDSEQTYKALNARGVFLPEDRLELIEAFGTLKQRHNLIGLDYEVAPQRVLKLSGGFVLPAVDAMGSRIKLKVRAYHDGELTAFLDDFPRMQRGFFPIDRCVIHRGNDAEGASAQAQSSAQTQPQALLPAAAKVVALLAGQPAARSDAPAKPVEKPPTAALIEAECSLEWITLLDKRAPGQGAATGH